MNKKQLRKLAETYFQEKTGRTPESGQVTIDWDNEQIVPAEAGQQGKYGVRIIARRLSEEITVRLDRENGSLLSWSIPSRYKFATETTIDKSNALEIVAAFIAIPEDAVLEEFSQEKAPDSHITNIIWGHMLDDLEVEGNAIAVQINSKTGEIIFLTKIWNEVEKTEDKISKDDARKIATAMAPKYAREQKYETTVVGQKYIPVFSHTPTIQTGSRMAKVWTACIVEDTKPFTRITTLSIDCVDGRILRVEHSK